MLEKLLKTVGAAGLSAEESTEPPVVVDATALDTGHRDRGIGRYVTGLLKGFAALVEDRPGQLLDPLQGVLETTDSPPLALLRLGGVWQEWFGPDSGGVAGHEVRVDGTPTLELQRLPVEHLPRWLFNECLLAGELESAETRLYHSTEPWSLPVSEEFATVLTCHDVIPLQFPDHYLSLPEGGLPWLVYYRTLLWADRWNQFDRLIAISEATKRSLLEYLDVDPADVSVVYNGIEHDDFAPVEDEDELVRVCSKYGVSPPFALYLGGYDHRKNVETLIRAAEHLPRDATMVLAGGMWDHERHRYSELTRELRVGDRVEFVGYVDEADLPALYSAADVFAYPSLAEGFGLQTLEAMAVGCPVVAGFATSLPEVVGDAGLLVNPSDPLEVGRTLRRVLEDEDLQSDLRSRGLERARMFSWRRTAERTLEVYEQTLRETRP